MAAVVDSIRGSWTIAVYTWREGIRKKILMAFLILSILVIFGSTFMTAFMTQATVMEGVETQVEIKIIKDICVSAISLFGILITIFISASVVPAEMENKVIYTILSKPVRRYQYLLGKFIGIQLIVIVNLLLMTTLFIVTLMIKEKVFPQMLLWSGLLTYFQFLIVSAFTFAISCTSTSSILPTIAGMFIYIMGNLTEYINDVATKSDTTDSALGAVIGKSAEYLFAILPNLRNFDLRSQILNLPLNDPPTDVMVPNLIAYGLAYAFSGYILALLLFYRREL